MRSVRLKMNFFVMTPLRLVLLVGLCALSGCGKPEDPARVELRARLKQDARLTPPEIERVMDEVNKALAGKTVRFTLDGAARDFDDEQRAVVLGMLTYRAGVYDEGLRTDGGRTSRVLNGPGKSASSEYEATRKLWIDPETFLPRHFEFSYGVGGMPGYSFDLVTDK
jgi:hypothetical protein